MRFIRSKKADADTYSITSKWWYYLLAIPLVALALIFIFGKGIGLLNAQTTVAPTLKEDILAARLVNVCFSYEEEGRIYQNVLDKNKLTKKQLQDCLVDQSITVSITSTDNSFEQIIIHSSGDIQQRDTFSRFTLLREDGKNYPATIRVIT